MPADLPAYHIFIASPGDVPEERARALRVIERLGGEFADQLHLSAIAWERKTYGAHADFQAQIEATRDCHLVVGILWQRVGTPLDGLRYPREDGTPFESGTVFEIETALNLRRNGTLPDVTLFKKRAPPQQALSPEDAQQLAVELPLLDSITRRWFRTESGAFKAAFNDFTTPESFEALLEQHLRAWLAERGHAAEGRVWRIETEGSPYPGLVPYEARQAQVFFGRGRARLAARIALSEAASRGCPFLLIVGGSGAGKSSLARAGLLPSLALPGTAPGVDAWRVATLRPGAMPLGALAEAIFTALPSMAEGEDGTPGAWAATLRHLPERAPRAVEKALARAGAASGQTLRLLLLADQLEEAFDAPAEQRQAFGAALAALARGGQWVVATLRADRYPALLEQPDLLALQAAGATQNLVPPDAEDIAAIIRDPARAAGLQFERDSEGRDLAQLLRDDMAGADALPLLQMAMARLFVERDRGANRLTFAAYAAMGGLRGAIQARADAVFAGADAAAHAELPAVLLALTAGLSEAGQALARPVAEAQLATSPARRALLRVLVEGRLLVSERTATGEVQLRVAHEALLRHWPQATRILAPEHLRAKPRLEAALVDWRDRGAKARDLLRGSLLEAGLGLLRAHAAALPPALAEYITRSRRADRFRRFGALGAAGGVATVFGVLALLAWGFAQKAEREAARAESEAGAAVAAGNLAEQQRAQAERALTATRRAVAQAIWSDLPRGDSDRFSDQLNALWALALAGEPVQTAFAVTLRERGANGILAGLGPWVRMQVEAADPGWRRLAVHLAELLAETNDPEAALDTSRTFAALAEIGDRSSISQSAERALRALLGRAGAGFPTGERIAWILAMAEILPVLPLPARGGAASQIGAMVLEAIPRNNISTRGFLLQAAGSIVPWTDATFAAELADRVLNHTITRRDWEFHGSAARPLAVIINAIVQYLQPDAAQRLLTLMIRSNPTRWGQFNAQFASALLRRLSDGEPPTDALAMLRLTLGWPDSWPSDELRDQRAFLVELAGRVPTADIENALAFTGLERRAFSGPHLALLTGLAPRLSPEQVRSVSQQIFQRLESNDFASIGVAGDVAQLLIALMSSAPAFLQDALMARADRLFISRPLAAFDFASELAKQAPAAQGWVRRQAAQRLSQLLVAGMRPNDEPVQVASAAGFLVPFLPLLEIGERGAVSSRVVSLMTDRLEASAQEREPGAGSSSPNTTVLRTIAATVPAADAAALSARLVALLARGPGPQFAEMVLSLLSGLPMTLSSDADSDIRTAAASRGLAWHPSTDVGWAELLVLTTPAGSDAISLRPLVEALRYPTAGPGDIAILLTEIHARDPRAPPPEAGLRMALDWVQQHHPVLDPYAPPICPPPAPWLLDGQCPERPRQ